MKWAHRVVYCGLVLLFALTSARGTGERDALPALEVVLDRLGRVAALYADTALRFTCEETIKLHHGGTGKRYRFEYVYGRTESGDLEDFRYRPGPDRKRLDPGLQAEVNLEALGLPEHISRAYSWVFTFERPKRPLHQFELAGRDRVLGRPALGVRFQAVRPFYQHTNEWDGTIWIDEESFQPLVVRATGLADRPAKAAYDRLQADPTAEVTGRIEFSTVTTEFGVVENGMRFPSRVLIERASGTTRAIRSAVRSGRTLYETGQSLYRVEQAYSNYQFYGVRTVAEIRASVLDGADKR